MIKILRAKLHGICVTDCDLNYHGSITLDPEICALVGIFPLEFVYIWNKQTGARISTYVLTGPRGSRCCILNGAAARTCQKGDSLIISAFEYVQSQAELYARAPLVATFGADNRVIELLRYRVCDGDGSGKFPVCEILADGTPLPSESGE